MATLTTAGMPWLVQERYPAPDLLRRAYSDEEWEKKVTAAQAFVANDWLDGVTTADKLEVVESSARSNPSAGVPARDRGGQDWRLIPAADDIESEYRHGSKRKRRQFLYDAMWKSGYNAGRLERFKNCGGGARVCRGLTSGELKVRAFFCHDRWCEKCSQAKTLRIGDNLKARLVELATPGLHIVLTTQHKTSALVTQVDQLLKHFKDLREKPIWKNAIKGGAYFLQMHVAESDGLWHVHVHIVGECHSIAGMPAWLDQLELSLAWHTITGDSTNVKVKRIHSNDAIVREVCRYAAKPVDGNATDSLDSLSEIMVALRSRRMCSTIGTWHGWPLNAKPPGEELEELEDLGRLVDIVWAARRGDVIANRILDVLWSRTTPERGPPALFARSWWTNKTRPPDEVFTPADA